MLVSTSIRHQGRASLCLPATTIPGLGRVCFLHAQEGPTQRGRRQAALAVRTVLSPRQDHRSARLVLVGLAATAGAIAISVGRARTHLLDQAVATAATRGRILAAEPAFARLCHKDTTHRRGGRVRMPTLHAHTLRSRAQ